MATKRDFTNISVRRCGVGETEYDEYGEQAPLMWTCDSCGSWIKLEYLDMRTDKYMPISEREKDDFLAEHNNCATESDFNGDVISFVKF